MQPVEQRNQPKKQRAPVKSSLAVFAFIRPRPQLESSTTLMCPLQSQKPPSTDAREFLICRSVTEPAPSPRPWAFRLGATPCGPIHSTIQSPTTLPKQDISTLLGLGHFYFALTGGCLFYRCFFVGHIGGRVRLDDSRAHNSLAPRG